jgi:signal transduction histidine kinase
VYSIQRRLLLGLAGGFAILIAGASLYLMSLLEAQALSEFDSTLRAKTNALAALTDQENGVIEFDYNKKDMPEFERDLEPEYFQFWLQTDGSVLMRSSQLGDRDLPLLSDELNAIEIQDFELPDGRAGRMLCRVYEPKGPLDEIDADDEDEEIDPNIKAPPLILAVARSREGLDNTLASAGWSIFFIGSLLSLLGILLSWAALAIAFRPIRSITQQVKNLNSENLHERVDLPNKPREFSAVIDQLNSLLARLDDSFQRERRFADNVAHELRTPIAELRSLATVGAQWPDDQTSVARFFEDVKDIAGAMEGVIADLLLLARCEAGIEQVHNAPTSLMQVLSNSWSKHSTNAAAKDIKYKLILEADIMLDTDAGKLGIILGNLLGNAVEYSPSGEEIIVEARMSEQNFELSLTNKAEILSHEELGHITEPFWRKDEMKSAMEHAGLGLSLVTSLTALLSMEVRFSQDSNGTFRASLTGPALQTGDRYGGPLRHSG